MDFEPRSLAARVANFDAALGAMRQQGTLPRGELRWSASALASGKTDVLWSLLAYLHARFAPSHPARRQPVHRDAVSARRGAISARRDRRRDVISVDGDRHRPSSAPPLRASLPAGGGAISAGGGAISAPRPRSAGRARSVQWAAGERDGRAALEMEPQPSPKTWRSAGSTAEAERSSHEAERSSGEAGGAWQKA